ncbi:E3 ubiquitin-protein ligase SDIR1 [Melia azedarach]|nr:E3 ubiquitin-protein ligase SDIR1 [Melia azedarach]
MREGQIAANGNSSHWPAHFPKMSGNSSKGKEKMGECMDKVADSFVGHGKGVDLSGGSHHNNEEHMSASHHSVLSPRMNRQRRLVRNGCISPHNIEIRAKQLSECSQNCSKDVEQDHPADVVPNALCTEGIKDIIAEENNRCKSKGIMIRSCTLNEHDPKTIHLSSSSATNHGEISGNHHSSGDAFGWRSAHNHSKNVDHRLPDSTGLHSRRNDDIRCASELDQIREPRHVANIFTKRQKKHESTSKNHRENSGKVPDDSEVMFLGTSGESSRSRSSRIQIQQRQRILDVDELSPEMRCSDPQGADCSNNDDSEARARQLEADEMLARELQEQFYHESPAFGGPEIDENIAQMLQQEEDALSYSNQNYHMLHPRTSSNSHRQPQSRLMQNTSNRRVNRTRVHNSSGAMQLRSRLLNRYRAGPPRARNFQFPLDMDLDMRIDILEALEAAVGDLGDMETFRNISHLQRDFNENDYEMLLALDENNHQQGASSNQINSLPLSTVQTDNFEEACAICLDTPTIGESIRHLPCLHKFHKDCIDPWLNRRPSCPVCKSSIT